MESRFSRLLGEAGRKVSGQEQNVVPSLPQRRQGDGDDIQAEEKVFPERAFFYQGKEVLVGGRQHPHVHFLRPTGPDHIHFLFLKDPKELGLHGQAGIADFIEKEGSPVRGLEKSRPRLGSPGERSFDMAKELALQEPLGNPAAIDRHKGGRRPRAVVMNGPGNQFFSCSTLPRYENGCRRGGRFGHGLPDLGHGLGLSQEAVPPCGKNGQGPLSRPAQTELFEHPPDSGEKFIVGKGFAQILFRSRFHRLDRSLDAGIAGDEHNLRILQVFPHVPDQVQPAGSGHFQVGDDQVHGALLQDLGRFRHPRGGKNPVTLGRQVPLQDFQRVRGIIDDQDSFLLFGTSHFPPSTRCDQASAEA